MSKIQPEIIDYFAIQIKLRQDYLNVTFGTVIINGKEYTTIN
ncbi:MAG: hypothetical protein ACTSVW_06570 [Candidatus Njordarchaeales archaeon]